MSHLNGVHLLVDPYVGASGHHLVQAEKCKGFTSSYSRHGKHPYDHHQNCQNHDHDRDGNDDDTLSWKEKQREASLSH